MKTAKYVSKNQRLRLVLAHGIPAEPITGRNAVPGIYIQFEQGFLEINEETARRIGKKFEQFVEMIERHSAFGESFQKIDESEIDPYKSTRKEIEPAHDIINIEAGGSIGKNINPQGQFKLSSEQNKALMDMATNMAKSMATEMAKTMAEEMTKKILIDLVKTEKTDDDKEKLKNTKTNKDKSDQVK